MSGGVTSLLRGARAAERSSGSTAADAESLRARRYPISRWYLLPLAALAAAVLARTRARPWQVTLCGLLLAAVAAGLLLCGAAGWCAAPLVLAAWFCDRLDGKLARRQGREAPLGAWLDANVDELIDVGLHAAVAHAAALAAGSSWPWAFFAAFVAGKYLLMYGLFVEEGQAAADDEAAATQPEGESRFRNTLTRRLYHLPANADVRVHLLLAALAAGALATELVLVAAYYNLRWVARYALVVRRLRAGEAR